MNSGQTLSRAPRPSSLADVLDLILDKGLVIDAYVRVSVVGIEILTIDARIVVASVDTYLHFAEAVNRLDLQQTETRGLTGLFGEDENADGDGGGADEDGQQETGDRRARDVDGSRTTRAVGAGSRQGRGQSATRRAQQPSRRRGSSGGDEDDDQDGEGGGGGLIDRLVDRGKWQN